LAQEGQPAIKRQGVRGPVTAGDGHTCELQTNGTLAQYHTCGLKTDGAFVCWGDNTNGQVGLIFKDGF